MRIYLNNSIVDLSKPVKVVVNGIEKFNAKFTADSRWLVEICGIFFNPARIYPAATDVSI